MYLCVCIHTFYTCTKVCINLHNLHLSTCILRMYMLIYVRTRISCYFVRTLYTHTYTPCKYPCTPIYALISIITYVHTYLYIVMTVTQHTNFCIYVHTCYVRTCVSFLQVKTYIHPVTGCEAPYVPMGRFIHIPPPFPRSDWANNFGRPWWTDSQYIVGTLTAKTRQIRIVNMVTLQEQVIEVCCVACVSYSMYSVVF